MSFSKLRARLSTLGVPSAQKRSASTSGAPQAAPAASPAPAAAPAARAQTHEPDYSVEARSLGGPKKELRVLYPAIPSYSEGMLKVDETHELHWELSGNKDGHPVVFLHGGPGGGISDSDRRWFDPSHYKILTFDQRGAGKSTPTACLENNTTWDLVADIEQLREHHHIEQWHVFGGSWGSTLSLAYAQTHPSRVTALILRGIFTLRRSELLFFYQDGGSHIFPEHWAAYRDHIPEAERGDFIKAYHARLTGDDEHARLAAAKRWSTWENATSKLYLDHEHIKRGDDDKWALAFARIESHFFQNRGWMEDGQLLLKENIDKIRHIPTVIVQGRYDVVCPATTAWALHDVFPEAEFHLVPDCGHSAREPGNMHRLIIATDALRKVTSAPKAKKPKEVKPAPAVPEKEPKKEAAAPVAAAAAPTEAKPEVAAVAAPETKPEAALPAEAKVEAPAPTATASGPAEPEPAAAPAITSV